MWQLYLKREPLQYETWDGIEELLEELFLGFRMPEAG